MSKLKTIRVNATMHTDLYVDINVPESATDEDIWYKIRRDQMIDGGIMKQHDDPFGGWTWEEPNYDEEFNPNAVDYSEWFKETDDE